MPISRYIRSKKKRQAHATFASVTVNARLQVIDDSPAAGGGGDQARLRRTNDPTEGGGYGRKDDAE